MEFNELLNCTPPQPVQLPIDQSGDWNCATQIVRFDADWQLSLWADTLNQPVSDNGGVVVKYSVAGKDAALGESEHHSPLLRLKTFNVFRF